MLKKYLIIVILICTFAEKRIFTENLTLSSLHDLMKKNKEIEYIKCYGAQHFEYPPFPLSKFPELQPNKGIFAPTFITKIPHGQVCSVYGWIKIDNHIITDFIPTCHPLGFSLLYLKQQSFSNLKKIKGKVAVITSKLDIYYSHWMFNILGRLALLESQGIEYDWLYVATDKPYMKQSLALWGVDPKKILDPLKEHIFIEADELIVPCQVGVRMPQPYQYPLNWIPLEIYAPKWNLDLQSIKLVPNIKLPTDQLPSPEISQNHYFLNWTPLCAIYFDPIILSHIQSKFLSHLQNKSFPNFSQKIFVSRKDTQFRNMINEDEIFSLFQPYGFVRYSLSKLPLLEQIALFHNAKIIVAAHGTGLTNLIFCKPETTVIEIFQTKSDCSLFYLSNILNLKHHCIQTMDFNEDIEGNTSTTVPSFIIQDFIKKNKHLLQ
ncbi:glycosyltransferase family 61 protein [Candidatus Dependentiae bacterium]|nr:glycosyltransferase family 61 protein [Candidatus Dependentiae bacterium]